MDKAPLSTLPVPRKVLKVSELTRYLKYLIEEDQLLAELAVSGEVSNLSSSPAGHHYFTLKDEISQLSCVLFRQQALQQPDEVAALQQGVMVIVDGYMTVYEPRGSYQLYVERLRVQGAGAMQLRFERLRQKLEAEGLFAEGRKRPLPIYPRVLALITAPDSRAYHDVLHRLHQQWPLVTVIEVGVSVQGEHAASEMVLALEIVNRLTTADVILLVRGGGSPEELACFNDERLARAIFASRIPVVTGIGHELDYTIADLVADRRAATPSLAAATVVPDRSALRAQLAQWHREAAGHIRSLLLHRRQTLREAERALVRASPLGRVRARRQRVDDATIRLQHAITMNLQLRRRHLAILTRQLQALDPLAILERGYAVVTDLETGNVINSISQIHPGQQVRTQVRDGSFTATVEGPL
jgi:exodeoxyribonuclease VII large subunit